MVARTGVVGEKDRLLRSALVLDAAVSGLMGAGMIAASNPVASFLGVNATSAPAAIGVGLLAWAALLVVVSRKPEIRQSAVRGIIAANIAWVAGSYLILIAGSPDLSTEGSWAVGIVAEGVALFALVQYLGLRRASGAR